jgi:hypothetical protein
MYPSDMERTVQKKHARTYNEEYRHEQNQTERNSRKE